MEKNNTNKKIDNPRFVSEKNVKNLKTNKNKTTDNQYITKYIENGIIPGMVSYDNDDYFNSVLNY